MVKLRILYQDVDLVAVDKPAGMMVHPGRDEEPPSMIVMKCLRDQLGIRVHPVHRLDRPTTGVLVFALNKKSAGGLQQAFETRQVSKSYLAVVIGEARSRWTCATPLQAATSQTFLAAETDFISVKTRNFGDFEGFSDLWLSLIRANPHTGRFHQIRRHLLVNGTPIVGDFRYAGEETSHRLGTVLGIGTRMLLHAESVELNHPTSGERLRISAPVVPEFMKCFPDI